MRQKVASRSGVAARDRGKIKVARALEFKLQLVGMQKGGARLLAKSSGVGQYLSSNITTIMGRPARVRGARIGTIV
jgi:hypothetical protein